MTFDSYAVRAQFPILAREVARAWVAERLRG